MSSLWPGLCTWCPAGGRSRWGWWRGRPPCWIWGAGCSTAALRPAARRKVNFDVVFTWLASPSAQERENLIKPTKHIDKDLRKASPYIGTYIGQFVYYCPSYKKAYGSVLQHRTEDRHDERQSTLDVYIIKNEGSKLKVFSIRINII